MKTKAINDLIKNRRAIYTNMFSNEIVSDDIINEMLENANWAPTHKLTEPWRFVVFKGEGLQKLGGFQAELYKRTTSPEEFNMGKYEKLKSKPAACSHVIAICMKRDEKESVLEIEEVCSVACAVQNMWLTASAHEVGCYWSTGGVTYYEEAKSHFRLGEKDKLMGFLYIGLSKGNWPEGRRKPIIDKVTWMT